MQPSIPFKTRPYILGDEPHRDPCTECIIKIVCNDSCQARILWNRRQTREKPVPKRVKIKKPKRRKKI